MEGYGWLEIFEQYNLAMKHRGRRECCMIGECRFFKAYQQSTTTTTAKFIGIAQKEAEEGIKMLNKITDQFQHMYRDEKAKGGQPNGMEIMKSVKKMVQYDKKELVEKNPPFEDRTQDKRYYSFSQQPKKEQLYQKYSSKGKQRKTELEQLTDSLEKIEFDEHDNYCQQNQNPNSDYLLELDKKSIAQIIEQSNQKVQQKMLAKEKEKKERREDSVSSGSSYPMTEYSSNESSNDNNDYSQYLQQDETNTHNIKSYNTASNLSIPSETSISSSYHASKLLYSPKKNKSMIRRLFINKKRVPRWAANIETIKSMVKKNRKDPRTNRENLYGVCVIQQLDTNIIFTTREDYLRGSSARWAKHLYNQNE